MIFSDDIFMMLFFSMARCGITREKEGVLSAVVVVQVSSDWLMSS